MSPYRCYWVPRMIGMVPLPCVYSISFNIGIGYWIANPVIELTDRTGYWWKSWLRVSTARSAPESTRSTKMLITPLSWTRRPSSTRIEDWAATRLKRSKTCGRRMVLTVPYSSSRLMKTCPLAVEGAWRVIAKQADHIYVPPVQRPWQPQGGWPKATPAKTSKDQMKSLPGAEVPSPLTQSPGSAAGALRIIPASLR